ncbi:acetyl esterase [Nocardia transvalensis]|uniref:Acetyl esterase n=1 Tax=Nocardia transvalensis TaxID=37333 RepID=A0A7W9UMI3_9NOCA|nr:alpha/beta hydrolase [Nocardia transvalensis]MBB5918648.1 acetyl esterase [Nocardia transvalensis]
MPMSPQTRAVVDAATAAFPKLGTEVLDAAEARRFLAARSAPALGPIPVAAVWDSLVVSSSVVPAASGTNPPVPVRVYRPADTPDPLPVVMFCHGGGFVICGLDSHDRFCRTIANATGALVISVDYRRAPEHPFPAAVIDADTVLRWIATHAEEIGGDPTRIAVAGDSAGGNLATVAALLARDHAGPRIAMQLLMYPMLDPTRSAPSHRENAHGYFTTADHLRWYWRQYLPDGTSTDPHAAPLLADPSGLPPAHIVTAEYDPLRDEGEAYAHHLAAAGVAAEIHRYDDMFHGFMTMSDNLPTARRANDTAFAALRKALNDR